ARHRPRLEGHRLRRRARAHGRAEDRRLVHVGQDRDRPDDHPPADAGGDQQGLRPDAFRREHPKRRRLLTARPAEPRSSERRPMFSHIMVGASDLERARSFYDALFAATGGKPGRMDEKGRLMYFHRGGLFMVTRPINGEPPTPANGGTIGFAMESEAEADAWHKAGRENGGTAIEE